jgi:hypothetical protein
MRGRYGTQALPFFQRDFAKMTKSWAYGAATVLVAHLLWLALVLTQSYADRVMPAIVVMLFVIINIAGIAAFITALKAPRDRLPLALTMAPLSAGTAALGNELLVAAGTRLDFSGSRSTFGLFGVALIYGLFVSAIGGLIGVWMAQRRIADAALAAPAPIPAAPSETASPAEPATRREPFIGELPAAELRMSPEPTVTSPPPGPDSTTNN